MNRVKSNVASQYDVMPKILSFILVVERLLKEDSQGYILKSNARNPFPTGYKQEVDVMG